MSLLRKSALAMVIPAAGALLVAGAGNAQAANLYGAIARGGYEALGTSTDHSSQAAANQAALDACGSGCWVTLEIKNSCGAAAQMNSRGLWGVHPVYYYGTGANAADAERMALSQVPEKMWWGATVIPLVWGSSVIEQGFIRDTVCTANAR
ncbi:DUF4189 domain-containing protein [Nocardia sp. NPDC050712]|uniref:DUF4189 domain-containing protein n=1 Tax=Nocardia sp. NPDC050712 TaxID=3155518 RepID=UPI0033F8B28E